MSNARRIIYDSKVLYTLSDQLSDLVRLPRQVLVHVQPCGAARAFYDPDNGSITICDEFIYTLGDVLDGAVPPDQFADAVVYATGFTFLHEAGHALIHQLELPVTGREEDVVDQFAVYLLVGNPEAERVAMAGADAFRQMFVKIESQGPLLFWDEHSLGEQRFVNINCWVLGSDPQTYQWMVRDDLVPADRAVRCPGEWVQIQRSFSRLLAPYARQ